MGKDQNKGEDIIKKLLKANRIKHSIETKKLQKPSISYFQVLSVEVAHSDKSKIQHYMEENGYILAHELPPPPHTLDHIYVTRDTWNSIS